MMLNVHFCSAGILPGHTGLVCIWRSSCQGQGHSSKKCEIVYYCNVKLQSAVTPVL